MDGEAAQLKKRLTELANRADARGCYTTTEFLTLAEQDLLLHLPQSGAPVRLDGGYDGAERKVAIFGSEALCGYVQDAHIVCVSIRPVAQKFADALTHRDFLGALMSLGIRRELLGDILLHENCGYLFCLESISAYIIEQLTQVRHSTVRCEISDLPPICTDPPPQQSVNVASERLDAILAAVYHLSRSDSQRYFGQEKVFLNSRLTLSAAASPKPGDIVSVRGLGRFRYDGIEQTTRKGRLRVFVRKY